MSSEFPEPIDVILSGESEASASAEVNTSSLCVLDYAEASKTTFDPLGPTDYNHNHLRIGDVVDVVDMPNDAKVIVYQSDDRSEFIGFVNLTAEVRKELGVGLGSSGATYVMGFAQMTDKIRHWVNEKVMN